MLKIKLEELAQGAFMEQFMVEMDKVISNIIDPNTDATTKRKITMTLTLAPSKTRDLTTVSFQIKTATAPLKTVGTNICVGVTEDGELVAEEFGKQVIGQQKIEETEEIKSKGRILKYKSN